MKAAAQTERSKSNLKVLKCILQLLSDAAMDKCIMTLRNSICPEETLMRYKATCSGPHRWAKANEVFSAFSFPGDKFSTDWDKASSKFKKQGKKTRFSGFPSDKYVSWNPKRSEFSLSEEVDPIKRTERSTLSLWTSPSFTLAGAIVILTSLSVYTILAPVE